jgi:hypothetical protein
MSKLIGEEKVKELNDKLDKKIEKMAKQELKENLISKAAELKEAHRLEKLVGIANEMRAIALEIDKKYNTNDLERLEFYMELFEANWSFCAQVMAYGYEG